MDDNLLPYRAEYAKSGRAACRTCKSPIAKDDLRLAVLVQARMFDGRQTLWHHFSCFFGRCRPKDISEIEHYQSLRWEDQEKIKKKIESVAGLTVPTSSKGKGKKRTLQNNVPNLKDFTIGYAKSGKSKCKLCEEFIPKNDIRISKKDYESETALQYGPHERWHHVDCFLKVRKELDFHASGSALPGFKTLEPDDQKIIKNKIPEEKRDDVDGPSPTKIPKEILPKSVEEEMKKQNKTMYKYRDELEGLTKGELISLLEYNHQEVPEGVSNILDRLADGMTFGALEKCEKCNGQLVFRSGVGYTCTGYATEWARCDNQTSKPQRVIFKVPKELKENNNFLEKYKGQIKERIFVPSLPKVKEEIKTSASTLPFQSCEFLIHKSNSISVDDLKSKIKELGGKTVSKFSENITAVFSIEEEINKKKLAKVLSSAKESDIPVLSAEVMNQISKSTSKEELIQFLKEKKISPWGSDVSVKLPAEKELIPKKSSYPKKSNFKSSESVKKVTVKEGLVVDPDSNLDKVAHVYRKGDIYSTVLSATDVQKNMNSYYRMQILEDDKKKKYWLFRAWGRIGTTIGDTLLKKYSDVDDCIKEFERLFEEKTGNVWGSRHNFRKVPGKMAMLEVAYTDEKKDIVPKPKLEIASLTLHKAIQDLITLIFDIETMKKTMLEFELDLEKMPLGKISQAQIQKAFAILSELQESLNFEKNKTLITDRTNRFYTLVPHDYGMDIPPLLDNSKILKEKIEVLNSLMEIEIAFKLLQECEESGNTIDDYYKKLNAEIIVLERDSAEFKLINTYVKNSHAKTHTNYTLEIEEIFKVERNGEAKKYKKFNKLPNKKLLWHGSRLTNFVGILSQLPLLCCSENGLNLNNEEGSIRNTSILSAFSGKNKYGGSGYVTKMSSVFQFEGWQNDCFFCINLGTGRLYDSHPFANNAGMRIAPPEAPSTGYMFGKGIYFADRVSKSANYCMTSKKNPTGLVLLCEVALGQMYELTQAKYIEKLPSGKHSVMGLGKTIPDPNNVELTPTGAVVPLGTGVDAEIKESSLLYNEYIVYDVSQVKIQYLVRLKFNYV